MSRVRLTISCQSELSYVHAACLAAIGRSEWIVAGIAETRITCQELLDESLFAVSPVRVAIVLASTRQGFTEATLHGATFGNEPFQSARLRQCVGQLATVISQEIGDGAVRSIDQTLDLMPRLFDPSHDVRSPVNRVAVAG